MSVVTDYCPQRHEIRTAVDRDAQGYCRRCKADGERRRRVGQSMKLAMVSAFEAAGVRFEDDSGNPVAPAEVVRQLAEIYAAGTP